MTDMVFSAGALDANRAGRLGPDQLRDLQAGVRYRGRGLVGHLLHSGDAVARDVASGQVASVEGAITKKIWHPGTGGSSIAPPSYQIWVASRQAGNQQFKSDKEFYDSAPDGGFVRLFYLPQSKWAVNFEWLPDAPQQDRRVGDRAEQALLDWRATRQTDDVVGEAEARAEMASIRREVASYLPENGLPAHEQLAPGRLREAIIGDWESPFLSLSVRADGALTATMGAGAVSGSCRARGHRCHGRFDGHRCVGRRRRTDTCHRRRSAESPALASLNTEGAAFRDHSLAGQRVAGRRATGGSGAGGA